LFGGGAAGPYNAASATKGIMFGAGGGVRIVWPGLTRQFPSTDVATP
jgi:hypothetical protein